MLRHRIRSDKSSFPEVDKSEQQACEKGGFVDQAKAVLAKSNTRHRDKFVELQWQAMKPGNPAVESIQARDIVWVTIRTKQYLV